MHIPSEMFVSRTSMTAGRPNSLLAAWRTLERQWGTSGLAETRMRSRKRRQRKPSMKESSPVRSWKSVCPFPLIFVLPFALGVYGLLSINGLGLSQSLLSNMSVTRFTHSSVCFQFVPHFTNPTASQVASATEPAKPSWTLSPLSSPPTSPPTRQRIFFSFESVVQNLSGLPIHNMMNTCSEGNLCWWTPKYAS